MSKKEQRRFVKSLLESSILVKGVNSKIRLTSMFSREIHAAVILRRKDGELLALGV
jgi:hypothetical protein